VAVIGDAYVVVHAITKGFESEVRRATRGINLEADGANVGQSFTRGFSKGTGSALANAMGDFGKQAIAARQQFQSLVRTSYTVGTALSILVSSIGSLAGGLAALAGTVAGAIPSLVVLPGIFSAIGLSALTAAAAFSGVGKAISAGMKTTTGAKTNTDQLTNAQKSLAKAIEASVEAQERFTKATRDAKEELQQLSFDAEDAALAEKRAAIELEKARETLSRTQDLPPNSRARREAQLAFAEAELNLRKAKDQNRDLAQEQNRLSEAAAKAGTEQYQQTETYKNAQKGVVDALRNQKDAEDALNKAKTGGSSAVDAFQTALDNLSPAAQAFVKFMVNDFVPALKQLRDAAAQTLLPQIQAGLTTLKTQLFPELKGLLAGLGTDVGIAFNSIISAIVDRSNKADLAAIFKQAGYVIQGIGKSIGSTYGSILSILTAADPIIRKFTDFLTKKTAEFDKFLNTKQASGELQKFFDKAGDIAARWGEILGNVFSGISNSVRAIFAPGGAGDYLLNWFRDSTAAFEKFSGSAKGQNYLAKYFKDVAVNSRAVLGALGAFTKEILKAGADPNVKLFWDTIRDSAPAFGELLKNTNKAAPSLAKLVKSLIEFANVTVSSGAIKAFFDVLRIALESVTKIMSLPGMQDLFNAAARIFAVASAFGLLGSIASFAGKVIAGGFMAVGKALAFIMNPMKALAPLIKAIRGGMLVFSMAFGTAAAPILIAVAAVAALVAILVLAYNNSESFRNSIKALGEALMGSVKGAFDDIKATFDKVFGSTESLGKAFKVIGDVLSVTLIPILGAIGGALVGTLGGAINTIIYALGALKDVFVFIFNLFKTIVGVFIGIFTGKWGTALDGLKGGLKSFQSFFLNILKAIISPFRGLINGIIDAWNGMASKFKVDIPKWVPKIGGQTFSFSQIPRIPVLAKGGVVMPSPGGTIARIGEAGRAERVEPLDPDGLSQRDKAMIKLLSGGQGAGMTVNVYPSPGMNESELASMVSRQIAFQLRRGGA
jgi:hypothetical protein